MRRPQLAEDIRESCRVHARLLDTFIAITADELAQAPKGFVADSLRETLDLLREERRLYGSVGPLLRLVHDAAA